MEINQLYKIFLNSSGVNTDTRSIRKGEVFFALSGENFNGNKFAAEALEKGASLAVIDDPAFNHSDNYLLVNNALQTLHKLATHHRKQLSATIIGLTGSNGKTTSKELISAVLQTSFNTYATKGNLNNHIGVPLSLLELNKNHEIAVIEMGANHQGEIQLLAEIALPDYGIITNIGRAHLEGFGGIEGVKKGKGELYDFIRNSGGAIFRHAGKPELKELARGIMDQITYGVASNCNFRGKVVSLNPFLSALFRDEKEYAVQTNLLGEYNFDNVALAVAVGRYFKISPKNIKKGVEGYIPKNNRSQVLEQNSLTYILDAYNANPTSMEAAIKNLASMTGKSHKLAILGDMLELGKDSRAEHQRMVDMTRELNIDAVFVGEEFGKCNGLPTHFSSIELLKDWFSSTWIEDSYILIKGSRKVGLDRLVTDG